MAWRRPGDKPLSEPMMASLLTHICITRPQWVNMWVVMTSWHGHASWGHHYWPFIGRIHQFPLDSHHKGPVIQLWCFLCCQPEKADEEKVEFDMSWCPLEVSVWDRSHNQLNQHLKCHSILKKYLPIWIMHLIKVNYAKTFIAWDNLKICQTKKSANGLLNAFRTMFGFQIFMRQIWKVKW